MKIYESTLAQGRGRDRDRGQGQDQDRDQDQDWDRGWDILRCDMRGTFYFSQLNPIGSYSNYLQLFAAITCIRIMIIHLMNQNAEEYFQNHMKIHEDIENT